MWGHVATIARSNMQRMPQPSKRRLMEGFAHGWMGVDGPRDVLEARAHLKRERKGCREFRHAGADGVNAEHDMVVGARDDAHEALVVLQRHCPPIGAERKEADPDFA